MLSNKADLFSEFDIMVPTVFNSSPDHDLLISSLRVAMDYPVLQKNEETKELNLMSINWNKVEGGLVEKINRDILGTNWETMFLNSNSEQQWSVFYDKIKAICKSISLPLKKQQTRKYNIDPKRRKLFRKKMRKLKI